MGYTLTIGNAYLDYDKEYRYLTVRAEAVRLDNAPAFGEPTDNTNSRWPSYTSWHNFSELVGLNDLFFKKDLEPACLIYEHPGFVVLSEDHKAIIDNSYECFKVKFPNSVATFEGEITENCALCRLEWLKFWVDWALDNCEMPIFYNS